METQYHQSISEISSDLWNSLVEPGNPFMDYRFLDVMEKSGCVGPGTGWIPRHITIYENQQLIAATPLYIKADSYGEFIFDWQWADAFHRSGINYYPKGTVAAPFTPASGNRLLIRPDYPIDKGIRALFTAMRNLVMSENLSGLHILFCGRQEQEILQQCGMSPRLTYQFHWENRGYSTFDDFLADLRSQKRKNLKKERAALCHSSIRIELLTGDDIKPVHIETMWSFYRLNQADKFGNAYLNKTWFELIYQELKNELVMTLGYDGETIVGCTLNFRKDDRLYGRYWGCRKRVDYLHFECCYYRLIDYAIAENIQLFEAGAQGEHKFLRGFATRPTYSAHWFAHPHAREVIGDYLQQETKQAQATILEYNRQSPLKYLRQESNHT